MFNCIINMFSITFLLFISETVSCSVISNSLWPHGLLLARLLSPWNSPGTNTGVGSHFSPQDLPDPGILYCRQILYHLSHQGSSNYISVVRYMVAKFNKKHFTYWFNMFFSFCVCLPWKLLLCWFQAEVLNGYKFDLSGSYCRAWFLKIYFSVWFNGFLIIYIWNSSSRV